MNNLKFSVLIPVYYGDHPDFFHNALESIYAVQTLKPDQIVIVIDGPISEALEDIINTWVSKFNDLITIVRMPVNVGLGIALSKGLEACKYDLVARMDSDDLATKDRFEKQLCQFKNKENLTICGSNVHEFVSNKVEIYSSRIVPSDMDDIIRFAKYRNPINHPTVMFNRLKIINIGGYLPMRGFEDYYLWVRCLLAGYTFYNIQENLVYMRGGPEQLTRRSGLTYVYDEIVFYITLKRVRFLTTYQFFIVILMRTSIRLLPKVGLKKIYQYLRKS